MSRASALASTTSEAVHHRLRHEILRGSLEGGARVTVAELRRRYGFGLTPIREALVRLAAEGLIVAEPNRSVQIRDISLEELNDLMLARQVLEADLLPRSIAAGDELWENRVVSTLHLLSRTHLPASGEDPDYSLWEDRHRAFHLALVSACGSSWLLHFWGTLVDHSERYRKLRFSTGKQSLLDPDVVQDEHNRIADAAIRRDVEETCSLMKTHLERTRQAAEKILVEEGYGRRSAKAQPETA